MKILLILAHPDKNSFNHALANTSKKRLIENGHSVIFHDLYLEKFDPMLQSHEVPKNGKVEKIIEKHCKELAESDGIVIVHPNWWGQPPAILKGWIDRVIRPGVAYEFKDGDDGEGVPVGLLKAHAALVLNTANTSKAREENLFKDPLETIWKNCIFDLCGVKVFKRRMFRIVVSSKLSQRKIWLEEVKELIDNFYPKKKK